MSNLIITFLVGTTVGFSISILTAHIVIDKIMESLKLIEVEYEEDDN